MAGISTVSRVHTDRVLTNVALKFMNAAYIANKIFPVVMSKNESNLYRRWNKGDAFLDEAKKRADGTLGAQTDMRFDTASFVTKEWYLSMSLGRRMLSNQDPDLNMRTTATESLADKIKLKRDVNVAASLAAWTAPEDVAGLWAPDDATNTFVADIEAAKETIFNRTGRFPNKMVLDYTTYAILKFNLALQDFFRPAIPNVSTSQFKITPEMIANLFDLDEVLVGTTITNSAGRAKGTDVLTPVKVWDLSANKAKGSCWLGYVTPTPSKLIPSAGYRFVTEDMSAGRYYDDALQATVLRAWEIYGVETASTDLGYLFRDTHTT